jgi:thiamine kinase-like enzyme
MQTTSRNPSHSNKIRLASGQVFEMTPAFLNRVLSSELDPEDAAISAVQVEQLTGETHFNAVLCRLHLSYHQPNENVPKTLIAKLPTARTELHERAQVFQPGSRENWFYRAAAAHSPLQVPRCYLNDTDLNSGASVLLLEDLSPAAPGNWLSGATLEQACQALESLARLHARWWGQDQYKEIQELNQLLSGNSEKETSLVQDLFDDAWPRFVDKSGPNLPEDVRCLGEAIVGNMHMVDDFIEFGSPTLVHGDFRIDNIIFGEKDGEPICWVIDWEDVYFDSGMIDVSWFLGGCLPIEAIHHEKDLLRLYHQELLSNGVEDYTWVQCYVDYCNAMYSSFVQGVLSATLDANPSEKENQFARTISERFISAAERLRLAEQIDL